MEVQVPGFQIEGELGSGAMASVYLATQTSLDRKVALKIMAASLAADQSFCERFLREGRMLARLSHPHTVTIHDIGSTGHHYYMAMEYLPGGTLKDKMRAGMSLEQGLKVLRQIAEALGYAHSRGVVHRDVKPANILFRENGSAVLSDFGIAKPLGEGTQFTQAGFAVGTPSYMSPEQAQGKELDGRSDLYALGIVLHELLTGKPPFEGTDTLSTALMHLTQPVPQLPPALSRYQNLIDRLMAKTPEERFANADALVQALDAVMAGTPNGAAAASNEETQAIGAVSLPEMPAASQLSRPSQPGMAPAGAATSVGPAVTEATAVTPAAAPQPSPVPQSVEIPTAPPVRAAPPVAKPAPSRLGLVAAAVGLVLVGLVGGGGYWLYQQSLPPMAPDGGNAKAGGDKQASGEIADTTGGSSDATPDANRDESKPADASGGTVTGETGGQTNAGDGKPLLMPGKKSLFQRVLAKPGARLHAAPGGAPGTELPAFSVLYVYERKTAGDGEWLAVGAGSGGSRDGWLKADAATDWKQTLVLKFTERSGRSPVLFLNGPETVEQLLTDPADARSLLAEATAGKTGGGRVLAIEPPAAAIPQDQFYLLPIFEARETFDANGGPVQLLQVASIDPGGSGQGGTPGAPVVPDAFRTGIVFVIDTSVSMQPYIDQVRQVVRGVQQRLAKDGHLSDVSFGLVAFRNNTDKTPGLEYVSRRVVDLKAGSDPQQFLKLTEDLKATTVSSHSFSEDAFAGINTALTDTNWSGFGGRLVVLITDAGALRKADPLSATGMNEAEMRELARTKQVKILALHLLTPAGKKNHAGAEQQYRVLTADPNPQVGDLYLPVPGGDVNAFGRIVDELSSYFAALVREVGEGKPQSIPELKGGADWKARTKALGYAMRMDFLGRGGQARAPSLVTAWTADKDLSNPNLPSFQICALLTKLQLNDLQQALKLIVDSAKRTQSSPQDFFQAIAAASAQMSRDPSRLNKPGFTNLKDSGLLGEYLDGLPYRSKVLSMSEELWLSLSVAEQQDFIDELDSKITLYQSFHNDAGNWVRFGNAGEGDALYRVPLSTLP
ncbi:MAG: protein kinase [Gammaproteobacteria bacterium]|nr:protein kinase [Gammaproteobacteria bacterium]